MGGEVGQSRGEMAIGTQDEKQLVKMLQKKKNSEYTHSSMLKLWQNSLGWELGGKCSQHSSESTGAGCGQWLSVSAQTPQQVTGCLSELTPQSRSLALGVCQSSQISQDLPSGAVFLWAEP